MKPRYSLLFVILLTFSTLSQAMDMNIRVRMDYVYGDHRPYVRFFKAFTQAIADSDVQMVARMIELPIKINKGEQTIMVENQTQFIQNYHEIITDNVYQEIVRQRFDDLYVHQSGLMIGRGQVWFAGKCMEPGKTLDDICKRVWVRVTAINPSAPSSWE